MDERRTVVNNEYGQSTCLKYVTSACMNQCSHVLLRFMLLENKIIDWRIGCDGCNTVRTFDEEQTTVSGMTTHSL